MDPTRQQAQSYGLACWLPYHGTRLGGNQPCNVYTFRSFMAPHQVIDFDLRDAVHDTELLQRMVTEWREISPLFLQDYYPLTPCSVSSHDWLAWQYHLPQRNVGIVQAFRRDACEQATLEVALRGLTPQDDYVWWNADQPDQKHRQTGQELREQGIKIQAQRPATATLIMYQQAR